MGKYPKGDWASVPDIVLEIVFFNLSFCDRFNASLVRELNSVTLLIFDEFFFL